MTKAKRIPYVHMYGGMARGGVILTACGKVKAHLPGKDTITLQALSRVTCPECLKQFGGPSEEPA